jgi:hypothetical protein
MSEAIDKVLRRKLISQAAERLWRTLGVRPGDPAPSLACPTCGAWAAGHPAPWRLSRERPVPARRRHRSNPGQAEPFPPRC